MLPAEVKVAVYRFEVRTRSHVACTVEHDAADHDALRLELARFAGQLLQDHAHAIWADEDWEIAVTDQKGLILSTMNVIAQRSAATKSVAE